MVRDAYRANRITGGPLHEFFRRPASRRREPVSGPLRLLHSHRRSDSDFVRPLG